MIRSRTVFLILCLVVSRNAAGVEPARVVVDADTANGLDDLFAIVRVLVEPGYRVEGLCSAQWANAEHAVPDTVAASQRINGDLLRLTHRESIRHPLGARRPLANRTSPRDSAAARWIIERAHATPPGEKLLILSLGALTNLASALLIDPGIIPKIHVAAMGLEYDDSAGKWSTDEFNARNDPAAVEVLFAAEGLDLRLMTGAVSGQLSCDRSTVAARLAASGPLGEYLLARWSTHAVSKSRSQMWDVALVQAMLEPESAFLVRVPSSSLTTHRKIGAYTEIDQARMQRDYWTALSSYLPGADTSSAWGQFRGPNASGVCQDSRPLPDRIGREEYVLWRVPLPPGHSSPAIAGGRIYLTAARGRKLVTIALDRSTGKMLWEREAPLRGLEPVHQIGNHAQPTCATDGERVVSLFGSSGILCHDRDGERLWYLPMGPFNNDFGAGASPIIIGDRVIIAQDHDEDSFLLAVDKRTGETLWRTGRPEFPRGYATPIIWDNAGRKQVVVAGTLRVVGYDLETGKEAWTARGISRLVNVTPTVDESGVLYVTSWTSGGDATDRFDIPPFAEFLKANDKNGDGLIVVSEVPGGPLKSRFNQVDRDKSGKVTREEFEGMRTIMDSAKNVCMAIRPGGSGDITTTHVLWRHDKKLPYVPSPLVKGGVVYVPKKGGIVSSLDAKTGKPIKEGRVSAQGNYYSSPVAGDGKVYLINQRGDVSVISEKGQWEEIGRGKLREETYATPAIVDGRIYVRTLEALYCFGLPGSPGGKSETRKAPR